MNENKFSNPAFCLCLACIGIPVFLVATIENILLFKELS
jgi:hypothetical protein